MAPQTCLVSAALMLMTGCISLEDVTLQDTRTRWDSSCSKSWDRWSSRTSMIRLFSFRKSPQLSSDLVWQKYVVFCCLNHFFRAQIYIPQHETTTTMLNIWYTVYSLKDSSFLNIQTDFLSSEVDRGVTCIVDSIHYKYFSFYTFSTQSLAAIDQWL